MSGRRYAVRLAQVYAGVLALVAAVAGVTAVGFAGSARDWLGFGFAGIAPTLHQARVIFADNAALLSGALFATLIAGRPSLSRDEHPASERVWRRARIACDAALLFAVSLNCTLIGVAVGAYGRRMIMAMLPHGPVELLAFAGALALYLSARGGQLRWQAGVGVGAAVVAVLGTAAVMEALLA